MTCDSIRSLSPEFWGNIHLGPLRYRWKGDQSSGPGQPSLDVPDVRYGATEVPVHIRRRWMADKVAFPFGPLVGQRSMSGSGFWGARRVAAIGSSSVLNLQTFQIPASLAPEAKLRFVRTPSMCVGSSAGNGPSMRRSFGRKRREGRGTWDAQRGLRPSTGRTSDVGRSVSGMN